MVLNAESVVMKYGARWPWYSILSPASLHHDSGTSQQAGQIRLHHGEYTGAVGKAAHGEAGQYGGDTDQ